MNFGSKEGSSTHGDQIVITVKELDYAESASGSHMDCNSRFFVKGKVRPIHIIIRSTESEFDRHEARPIRNQRTKMNLVSPYPSRSEFHGNYMSRTTLYENQGKDNRKSGRGDASSGGMQTDAGKRSSVRTSRRNMSQSATSDSGPWTEELKKDYGKHLLRCEIQSQDNHSEKFRTSDSTLKSQLQADYRNHLAQKEIDRDVSIAILRDQVKDLIKLSESQGEQIRVMGGQGTSYDQRLSDATVQNRMQTVGDILGNGSDEGGDVLTYDGPDYLGDMNSNSSSTSNPINSHGIFAGMSPNGYFSHPKSPSTTPTQAQLTTSDTDPRGGVPMLPSPGTQQMPISAPGPSDGRCNGQSYSNVPIPLNASAMSNPISYSGIFQHPYMYHPGYGMYNYQSTPGGPSYPVFVQNTSNPNDISNFNRIHQTTRPPRFVDVLTSSTGARPTTQSAGAPLGTQAHSQPDAGTAGQISKTQTLPVFNIRTRSGGTTGVPAYTGGTARIPAYTGRERTASPNSSVSSFTISYSDHSSYHGSSYQSSLLGHDDSERGSDAGSFSPSSDLGELTNSDHEVALTGQDNILTDLQQNDMILFDIWSFANERIMKLKSSSPSLGGGYAFRWGGDMITETDMRVIGGIGGLYDDNFIHCIYSISKHCNIYTNMTSVHFVDPLYGQTITRPNTRTRDSTPMGLVRSIAEAISKGKTDILMSVNVDNNHWFTAISEFSDPEVLKITGIEVLMVDRTHLLERIGDFYVRNWKIIRPRNNLPKIALHMMIPPESPLMTDGSSCGPFMCIMMDLHCRGIPMREFRRYVNQNNIVEARRRIAAFLNGFCCTGRRALAAASRA